MKKLLIGLSLLSSVCFANTQDYEWKQLFNGTNLDGWDFKIKGQSLNQDPKNTFRVATSDGVPVLRADYSNYTNFNGEPFGHIGTKDKYSYYRFAVEYRFYGSQVSGGPGWAVRNNGIMFHSQSMASMGVGQNFPISMEAQLLVRGSAGNWNGQNNICTPGTHYVDLGGTKQTGHCKNGSTVSITGTDAWVRAEVIVLGDSLIHHLVDGDTVISYKRVIMGSGSVSGNTVPIVEDSVLSEGHIALQAESHPTEFRKIEIVELAGCMDTNYVEYKSYFIKEDNSKCTTEAASSISSPVKPIWNVNVLNKSIHIEYTGNGVARLVDVQGRVVATESFAKNLEWNVESLVSSGVYQVQLETEGKVYSQSVVFFNK